MNVRDGSMVTPLVGAVRAASPLWCSAPQPNAKVPRKGDELGMSVEELVAEVRGNVIIEAANHVSGTPYYRRVERVEIAPIHYNEDLRNLDNIERQLLEARTKEDGD